jgi:hypothetical protein
MKWSSLCLVLATACQSGQSTESAAGGGPPANTAVIQLPKAQVTEQYRADITTLCDVVHLSGADQKPKEEQWPIIAMFLGGNSAAGPALKTNEAHEFLIAIQPLQAEPKALALETEAKRVGLAKCELANEWRAAAAAPRGQSGS